MIRYILWKVRLLALQGRVEGESLRPLFPHLKQDKRLGQSGKNCEKYLLTMSQLKVADVLIPFVFSRGTMVQKHEIHHHCHL